MSDIVVNAADDARPHTFTGLVGQPFAHGVGEMMGAGNISGQGYILAGLKGCGKTSLARIIAMSLNCDQRDEYTGDPCGECSSCVLALKGAHHQIEEINAASQRGIHDIKELLKNISLAVPRGYRVYILDEVHMLTREAFSVLLKPMEQPPENVIFIATTTNPEAIPDTIVSRVPIIPILPLEDDDLERVLLRVIERNKSDNPRWGEIGEDDIRHAIRSAEGSARQAITTLSGLVIHGVSSSGERDVISSITESIACNDVVGALERSLEALGDKTVHPSSVIRGVMDSLILELDGHDNPAMIAKTIAELSLVSRDVSSSTPTVMVASRIAACVQPPDVCSTTNPPRTQGKKDTPQTKRKNTPRVMRITKSTSLSDVFDRLFSQKSRDIIGEHWMSILDDDAASEIFINSDGALVVSVDNPTDDLTKSLEVVFSPVVVEGRM